MKKLILAVTLFVSPMVSFAHGDHAPKIAACAVPKECTMDEVKMGVPKAVELLSANGKIAGSWTTAKIEKVEQKQFKKGPEWVATLLDEKQTDSKKQRLYIFITMKGYLNGANFTGE
jgi:hypothetical protein